jgi:hypothetical protein
MNPVIIYTREFWRINDDLQHHCLQWYISKEEEKALWRVFIDRVDHDGVLKMLLSEEIFAFLRSLFDAVLDSAVFVHPDLEQAVMTVSAT